jgi:hypothetical protein
LIQETFSFFFLLLQMSVGCVLFIRLFWLMIWNW